MSSAGFKTLGIILIICGIAGAIASQMLVSLWQKKKRKDL